MGICIVLAILVGCAMASPIAIDSRNRGSPPHFSCDGRDNGYYADHNRNCQIYHSCKDGEHTQYACKPGDRFSEKIWACLPEDQIECPIPVQKRFRGGPPIFSCEGRDDGFFADTYRNCQVYYMCKDGAKEDRHCQSGERFDEHIWACMPADEVECSAASIQKVIKRFRGGPPVFSCAGKEDGFYPDLYRQCHVYYECKDDQSTTFSCPAGTLYDSSVNACAQESGTTCPPFKRELPEPVVFKKALKQMDDRLVRDLEQLLRKLKDNRR